MSNKYRLYKEFRNEADFKDCLKKLKIRKIKYEVKVVRGKWGDIIQVYTEIPVWDDGPLHVVETEYNSRTFPKSEL